MRPTLSYREVDHGIETLRLALTHRLAEKGYGVFVSRHEILGAATEEFLELVQAVQGGTEIDLVEELIDLAVACVFGAACIQAKKTEW